LISKLTPWSAALRKGPLLPRRLGECEGSIPAKISQEMHAERIGTTSSRVSFFVNKFGELGFIAYKGKPKVHQSLLIDALNE
jgi:hypothetical protein